MRTDSHNPITLAIVRQLLEAVAEEMGATLQRTAVSANIKERRDFSCAVFDAKGQLAAQAAHVPVHLGSMESSIATTLEHLGPLAEGSAVLVNDPYAGGTHLPDLTLISPVFLDGVRVGYVASRAHHADVGGTSPGSMTLSRHIDEEGVRIPPTPLAEAQEVLFADARNPEEREADLHAQRLANDAGAAALRRLVQSHGPETFESLLAELRAQAEALTRSALRRLPPGTYDAEAQMDDDGTGGPDAALATIRLRLTIGDGTLRADFGESDAQVVGCVNCPAAVTRAAVCYGVTCLARALGGDLLGSPNAGTFAPLEVVTQSGTLVDAAHPAAVAAGNTETSQRIVDVVFAALAKALPQVIPADSCGTMSSVALGGSEPQGWTYYETIGGGSGASAAGPGASAVQCHMTNTLNTPAEALELQYPLRVRRYAVKAGSGGDGVHRGGDGIVRELEFLSDGEGTLLTDRRRLAPHGLAGGGDGAVGRNLLNGDDLGGKARFTFCRGDVLTIETPGGGGWSEPTHQGR